MADTPSPVQTTQRAMSGPRAIVHVNGNAAGVFRSISYGVVYGTQAVHVLGRYSAADIDYTSMEPVSISLSGWRVIGAGPHDAFSVPHLSELLRHNYINITVVDRLTGKTIANISNVRPTGYSTSINDKQLEEINVSAMGLLVSDESNVTGEGEGGDLQGITATGNLPTPTGFSGI